MRRPKSRLIAAPPIRTGNSWPFSCSSATQAGICLEVETSRAERPIASASFSTAAVMIVSIGTCLPRSTTV
jgi:hypothetical protein